MQSSSYRSFFLADILVTVAERYFVLTFAWWLLTRPEGSGTRLAFLMTLESVPALVLGFLLGPLIDGASKKRWMLCAALLQTAVVIAVAVLLGRDQLSFFGLCVAGLLLGCLVPAFEGAVNAALPQVVADDQVASAAAVSSTTLEFSNVAAAALSSAMIAGFGFEAALWLNAALYGTGAVCVGFVSIARPARQRSPSSYFADLQAGVTELARLPGLAAFVAVYITKLFLTVPLLVLIPLLVRSSVGDRVDWVGILETSFSVGAITCALLLSTRKSHERLYLAYCCGLLVLGGLMLLLMLIDNPFLMLPNVIAMGGAVALLLSLSSILFQRTVPDHYKGRFFGILETLAAAVTPLGYGLVGISSTAANADGVLLVCGVGLLILASAVAVIPRVAVNLGEGASRAPI